jgi:hypothetical protein
MGCAQSENPGSEGSVEGSFASVCFGFERNAENSLVVIGRKDVIAPEVSERD